MNHAAIVSGVLLALAMQGAVAQDEKKPATGASAQGAGQGQADVKADSSGAVATGKAAGAADAQAGESSATLAQGTEINATLTRPVDADKAKPGDEVSAKSSKDIKSGGKVIVPRGARLIGHVIRAKPHGSGAAGGGAGGGAASELGIVFDRAVLKDGSVVMLNGAVAAIGSARAAGAAGGSTLDSGAAGAGSMAGSGGAAGGGGGGLAGAVGGTVGGVASTTTGAAGNVGATVGGAAGAASRSAGAVGGFDASGDLKSGSRGVFGVRDFGIAGAATGTAEGSVITSAKRNVRLESGTQMLVVAGGSAGKQPAAKPDAAKEKPKNNTP